MDPSATVTLNTGNPMPVTGFGTWQLGGPDAVRATVEALKQGYRLIDTSGNYGNQAEVGQAIQKCGFNRQKIFVVTKIEKHEDAYAATRQNLKELQLDYADLVLIHWPPTDTNTSIKLWEGLIKARDEGLTRDIGVSNYSIEQMEELIEATDEVPVVNQVEWTPFGHDMKLLDWADDNEIVIQAYSSLTRGSRLDNPLLGRLAGKYSKKPPQIILRWNLQHGVVPIVKASGTEHIRENLDVFDFKLSEEDISALDSLNEQYSVLK